MDSLFREIKNAEILILDDLGEERNSGTTRTDFIKEAQNNSAVASRIQDPSIGQILNLDAVDYRLGNYQKHI